LDDDLSTASSSLVDSFDDATPNSGESNCRSSLNGSFGGELKFVLSGPNLDSYVGDIGLDDAAVGIRVGDWALDEKAEVPVISSL
jgi:hypothetical protein